MSILTGITGKITFSLTSAEPEKTIASLNAAGIDLWEIEKQSELSFHFTVSRENQHKVASICERHGGKLDTIRFSGVYWRVRRAFTRPVFIIGLAVILMFFAFLPTRILFVQIQGNTKIPTRQIMEAAQECGISFGASRREVRSEKVKNALLSQMPQLQWVGVNTSGCVATVSVRERMDTPDEKVSQKVTSIVADQDGYVLSMTVTKGNPLCTPGQYVKEGQTLVSGYTDCGIFIQATRSEAEILAQTTRQLEMIFPSRHLVRTSENGRKQKYSLLIGKKRINLRKGSGILDSTCGRIYEEKYATLPGGFQLPFGYCVETCISYEVLPAELPAGTVQDSLSRYADQYLQQQMTAGTIHSRDTQFFTGNGVICLDGSYTCQEMIGRVRQEQIGE